MGNNFQEGGPGNLSPEVSNYGFVNGQGYLGQGSGANGNPAGNLSLTDFSNAIQAGQNGANNANGMATNTAGNQQNLVGNLQQQAEGFGPAAQLAQQQFNQNTQQGVQQMQGGLASNRGIDPALALRTGANNGSAMIQAGAGQAAQNRLQSQLGAVGELGGVLGQERAGDIGQEQAQTAMMNSAIGGQQGNNNTLNSQNLGLQGLYENASSNDANNAQAGEALNAGAANQNAALTQKYIGGVSSGAGSLLAAFAADGADLTKGGFVDGPPKQFAGDDKRDDKKLIMAQDGEKVIPASIADDPEATAAFVDALNKSKNMKPSVGPAIAEIRKLDAKLDALKVKLSKFGVN